MRLSTDTGKVLRFAQNYEIFNSFVHFLVLIFLPCLIYIISVFALCTAKYSVGTACDINFLTMLAKSKRIFFIGQRCAEHKANDS